MTRIGYFGDGVWAQAALQKILSDAAFEVALVVGRYPAPDGHLKRMAETAGIPFYCVSNVNSAEFVSAIAQHRVDLNVSMSFNQIIREELNSLAPKGFINCHAGALPFYRGRNVINWAIINGEERLGITVHYIDSGIDTGDLILQRFIPIGCDEHYARVLDRACNACAEVLFDALMLVEHGKVTRMVQTSLHPVGFYCGRRRVGDEFIDWSWTSRRIHNFVRAISPPGPAARTFLETEQIAILQTRVVVEAPSYIGTPGEVVFRTKAGIHVKTGDSVIHVDHVCVVTSEGELGERIDRMPKIGTRFCSTPDVEARLQHLEAKVRALEQKLEH